MAITLTAKAAIIAASLMVSTAGAETDQQTIDAIRTLWQNQHQALDAHDLEGVMTTNCLARPPKPEKVDILM